MTSTGRRLLVFDIVLVASMSRRKVLALQTREKTRAMRWGILVFSGVLVLLVVKAKMQRGLPAHHVPAHM